MSHILIIEDNSTIAEGIRRNLVLEGYDVSVAHNATEALRKLNTTVVHLVILDLMLPRTDGFHILRDLRGSGSSVPVLILSARGADADKVRGFRLGADDYVVKPFGLMELLARVAAVLRRSRGATPGIHETSATIQMGDFQVHRGEHMVTRAGIRIQLRPKEYDLLIALIDRRGDAASRISLLREVWGYADNVMTRTVDTHIAALRQRLETDPRNPRYIITVRNVGYRVRL